MCFRVTCKFRGLSDALSTHAHNAETTSLGSLTNEFRKFPSPSVSQPQYLTHHRDNNAIRTGIKRPVDLPLQHGTIDLTVICERRMKHRQHTVKQIAGRRTHDCPFSYELDCLIFSSKTPPGFGTVFLIV